MQLLKIPSLEKVLTIERHWNKSCSSADMDTMLDADLLTMDMQALRREAQRLRNGIRAHRDATGHDLCWHHPQLWALLPEQIDHLPEVPEWPDFLRGCVRYRQSLDEQLPHAPRVQTPYED